MNEEQQDKEYLAKILRYLQIHKPEEANEREARRYLAWMKGFAERAVGEDLEFAELLLKAIEEARKQSEENRKEDDKADDDQEEKIKEEDESN